MDNEIRVGIADMKITRSSGLLVTYALGSCVGVCIYDPVIHLAGMIHIMLPCIPAGDGGNMFKYADVGIAEMIRKMNAYGGRDVRMSAKIAGGAKMFDIPGDSALGNIGKRNVDAVKEVLRKYKIRITNEDVGGTIARTVSFDAESGQVKIRSYGQIEKVF